MSSHNIIFCHFAIFSDNNIASNGKLQDQQNQRMISNCEETHNMTESNLLQQGNVLKKSDDNFNIPSSTEVGLSF